MKQKNNPQPNSSKKRKVMRWFNLLIVIAIAFFGWRIVGQVQEYNALQDEIAYYEEQLLVAEQQYQDKLGEQELFHNDSYLERFARERLGMVKDGEVIVSPVKTDLPEADDSTASDENN